MKIAQWRIFIEYFGLSIKAKPSKVVKNNVHVVHIGSIPITSYVNPYISRKHPDKQFNLEPPKLRMYQVTKKVASKIAPHIYSDLRYLGVIFDKAVSSVSTILAGADRAVTAESFYGTQNEQ